MTDDDQPVPDHELAALLRRVSNDLTLQPQYRDRARAAMFAEFDAIVAGIGTTDSKEHLSVCRRSSSTRTATHHRVDRSSLGGLPSLRRV